MAAAVRHTVHVRCLSGIVLCLILELGFLAGIVTPQSGFASARALVTEDITIGTIVPGGQVSSML